MPYSLYRTRDGAGDSGGMSMALIPNKSAASSDDPDNLKIDYEHNARPRVGVAMRVGSIAGRTFASQDWWQTTLITEIISDTPEEVRFKTGNSEYVWKVL